MEYVYAMTRSGEAQHAAKYANGEAARTTECGWPVVNAFGPAFTGERGIQHPWRCDKCHRAIQKRAAA